MSSYSKKQRPREAAGRTTGPALVLVGTVLLTLLVLGTQKGTGQEKASGNAQAGKSAREWTVESHDRTNFPLVWKHRTLSCRECHLNLIFEGTPSDCEVCHWQRRQDDPYGLRLGTRCADCHTPQAWKNIDPAKWSHETAAGFRLEGIHRTLDCEPCHGNSGFEPRPTDCFSCHEADYRGTRDPNHADANFPTDCTVCHNQRSWEDVSEDASFTHTSFVRQGMHASAACVDCHQNGVYAGTPSDCASCHIDDYDRTADPNHRTLGFPLECSQCHGTSATSFSGAVFNHTSFVRQGMHASAACMDCHQNGVFAGTPSDCASCHINDYNSTTNPNHRTLAFPLDCSQCHGTSAISFSGAVFNHAFPIQSGRHSGFACADCHRSSNLQTFSCIDCHAHDQAAMNTKHNRVGGYAYNSQACYGCHPIGRR